MDFALLFLGEDVVDNVGDGVFFDGLPADGGVGDAEAGIENFEVGIEVGGGDYAGSWVVDFGFLLHADAGE